jgi:hypothetical protein
MFVTIQINRSDIHDVGHLFVMSSSGTSAMGYQRGRLIRGIDVTCNQCRVYESVPSKDSAEAHDNHDGYLDVIKDEIYW